MYDMLTVKECRPTYELSNDRPRDFGLEKTKSRGLFGIKQAHLCGCSDDTSMLPIRASHPEFVKEGWNDLFS